MPTRKVCCVEVDWSMAIAGSVSVVVAIGEDGFLAVSETEVFSARVIRI